MNKEVNQLLFNRWKSLVWSGIFVLTMLSILTPLSIITLSLIMVPLLMMVVTLDRKRFIIHLLVALGIILVITNTLGIVMVLICLFFLGPAVIMGVLFKKETAAHLVIASTVLVIVAEIILVFVVAFFFGANLVSEATGFIRESYELYSDFIVIPEDILEQAIDIMTQMIPVYIITFAVYYTMLTYWIGRKLLNRSGYQLAGLPPVKEWRLPRSIVWYYVGALLISYFIRIEPGSMFAMILNNLLPLLTFAFCVQAVSFLLFIADQKRWNKALPIIGIIACFILPSIISLLGVFDIMFDLRKRMQKEK